MRKAHKFYRSLADNFKGELNRAHFAAIYVNAEDTEPGEVPQIALEPALGDVPAAFRAVAQEARHALNAPDSAPHGATGAKGVGCLAVESPEDNEKTPGKLSLTGGSNLHLLAETGGFEPPAQFNPSPSLAVKSVRPLRHVSVCKLHDLHLRRNRITYEIDSQENL